MLCRAFEYCCSGGVWKVRGAGGDVASYLVWGILVSGAFGCLVLISMWF
jgi:hypothetical protein